MTSKKTASSEMAETELGTILATFLKSQEKRDAIFRADLEKVSNIASDAARRSSESLTRIEGVDGKIETAFELLNQSAQDRRTNWPTLFAGAIIIGGIMTSILLPLRSDISENRLELRDNHIETRSMIQGLREENREAMVERAIIIERHAQEQRMNRAWIDPSGRIAFPGLEK